MEGTAARPNPEVIPLFRRRPLLVVALSLALVSPLFSPALPVGARPFRPGPGYWLAAADGGVFAFGRAPFRGSLVGARLQAPVVSDANDRGVTAPLWWLDVETVNRWSADPGLNNRIITGVADGLSEAGIRIGVYSTYYQWRVITGDLHLPGVPLWIATGGTIADGPSACTDTSKHFAGGVPHLVQFLHEGLDGNVLCPAGVAQARKHFRSPPPRPVPEFDAPPPRARLR